MPYKISRSIYISATLVYLFLYIPLIIVIAYSFNDSRLNAEWTGFTFKWYQILFQDEALIEAAMQSLIIALVASISATLLGTCAALAMHKYRLKLLPLLVLIPITVPDILMGVSLLMFFVLLNVTLGTVSIILAHITFCIGFVTIIVRARLHSMDQSLTEAARDLGASHFQAFRLITLPFIAPSIIAGLLMAFTLSIDDFMITFFTAGVGTNTLPLQIYSMVRTAVTPEVNAISTLLMLLTLILIVLAAKFAPSLLKGQTL